MLKNPSVIDWAQRALVTAGAAMKCPRHGCICATENDGAVRRAVIVGRLIAFEDLSPNAAELALLETYLSLPFKCDECTKSSSLVTRVSRAT